MILHISTEGATAGTIKQSSLEGSVLPWFERWYEGPVPESLSRDDLLHDRTQYFMTGNQEEDRSTRFLTETFTKMRKEEFADLSRYGEIVLWFNSTVGEQLNLIDVITQIQEEASQPLRLTRVAPAGCNQAHSTAQLAELGPGRLEALVGSVRWGIICMAGFSDGRSTSAGRIHCVQLRGPPRTVRGSRTFPRGTPRSRQRFVPI